MLKCIKGVSESNAKGLVQSYSCPQKLFRVLNDPNAPVKERRYLLQDKFSGVPGKGENTSEKKKRSNHPSLSSKIFTTFTSADPHENVDGGGNM
jgi:hypothetical protein